MLIHLYNGKECDEFVRQYKTCLDIVNCFSIYEFLVKLGQWQLHHRLLNGARNILTIDYEHHWRGKGQAEPRRLERENY